MTATINGNAFEANIVSGSSDDSFGEELVLILGIENSTGNAIGLNVPTSIGTGSNQIAEDDFGITFNDDFANGTIAFFTVGTLNITRNDTTENVIEGDFNFTATDEDDAANIFNVTDGEFKVSYQ